MVDAKEWLTPKQLAQRWKLTEQTLANWRHEGRGPPFIRVANRIRYDLEPIEQHEENQLNTKANSKWHSQDK